MPNPNEATHVPAGSGPMYLGPGDRVRFLVTGAESHGGCFIVEATAFPGGGPPPHRHEFEDESFYILEGSATFRAGDQTIHARPGDFIHVPRGVVHSITNETDKPARALVIITPAGERGMRQFFEESFTKTTDPSASCPPITEELVKRMIASGAKNGVEFMGPG